MEEDRTNRIVTALGALAQPTRLRIVQRVADAGPEGVPAGQIARSLRCPASTLSFHLKELTQAGLLQAEPRGRFIRYSLRREALAGLGGMLSELGGAKPAAPGRGGGRKRRGRRGQAADRDQLTMFGS